MIQSDEEKSAAAGGANDFEAMFEESLRSVKPGGIVKGMVVGITATHVLIDVGYKSEGQIPIHEFQDRQGNLEVKVGEEVDVYFDSSENEGGGINLSRQRAQSMKVWEVIEKAFNEETPVEGTIIGKVKGGFKVDVGGVMGFLPGSHVDIRPTRNLDKFLGTKDSFAVLKFNRPRGNVVLSRRALLEKERDVLKQEVLKVLEEGVILEGTVKNITGYGAFVDLGGIDGILHISDMSWGRISHPSELLQVGQKVNVVVLKFDSEKERISLGMKQCKPNPWEDFAQQHKKGDKVGGAIKSITDFGVFIGLPGGIDGLVHLSDLSWSEPGEEAVRRYKKGDEIEAMVLAIDTERERISLGVKQMSGDPFTNFAAGHEKGAMVEGTVKTVDAKGAVIDLGSDVEGFLRASEISADRVEDARNHLKEGDAVNAMIINIDRKNRNINLSVKAKDSVDTAATIERMQSEAQTGTTNLGALLKAKLDNK